MISEWRAKSNLEDGDRLQPHHAILEIPNGHIDPPETFTGGAGDDTFTGGSGDDLIQGGGGNDTLNGGRGDDVIEGGAGNDVLDGNVGFDTLDGGAGDDVMTGGGWEDTVTYALATSGVTVNLTSSQPQDTGGAGVDTLIAISILVGSSFGDNLSVTGPQNVGSPYLGLYGGSGDDTLSASNSNKIVVIDGGAGDDVMSTTDQFDFLSYASAGAAVQVDLSRTDAQDTGGAGVDRISGFHWIEGTQFADTLSGTSGNDTIEADKGADVVSGGDGDDFLETDHGAATLNGGAGNDRYELGDTRDVVVEAAGGGYDSVFVRGSYTLPENVESLKISGSRAGVVVGTGNDGANTIEDHGYAQFHLVGLGGDDNLIDHHGGDTLDGGAGNDTLNDPNGHDTLIGGSGNDVYVASGPVVIVETADGGVDLVKTFHDFTLPDNVENLDMSGAGTATGNDLDNVIRSSDSRSVLDGEAGDDTLVGGGAATATYADSPSAVSVDLSIRGAQDTGGAGHDKLVGIAGLIGSAFDDVLSGAASANSLSGGDGADTLVGRGGADVLTGGAGANVFRYEAVADSTASAADRITDLTSADQVDLSKIDADTTHKGNQAFTLVSAFDHHAGELTVDYDAGTAKTTISGDVNGDGVADLVITADGDHHDFTGFVV